VSLNAAGVVIGDLASAAETRDLAGQVNELGRMDAVIRNAGVFAARIGGPTATGDLGKGYLTRTWLAVSNSSVAAEPPRRRLTLR
jgi:NAD(P)-dependent dehydrogenase (short-subunit alcohol dehydrogenase family)